MKHFQIVYFILVLIVGISCSNNDDGDSRPIDFAGNWSGTFTGGDNGTWNAIIDASGTVEGEAYSNNLQQSLPLNGSVDTSGDFRATVGTATNGATFEGAFASDQGSGTWENSTDQVSGTWTGSKD
ncbi:hypothetical protein [Flagellimonas oceanensis]|uniref:hypothetical protein n=1 Tax=Flagellimonas oceanensis TaxID=2499163 RepID=UPI000F8D2A58|nr:hypothetical protein [Allomuricauda oceanensis]